MVKNSQNLSSRRGCGISLFKCVIEIFMSLQFCRIIFIDNSMKNCQNIVNRLVEVKLILLSSQDFTSYRFAVDKNNNIFALILLLVYFQYFDKFLFRCRLKYYGEIIKSHRTRWGLYQEVWRYPFQSSNFKDFSLPVSKLELWGYVVLWKWKLVHLQKKKSASLCVFSNIDFKS